MPGTACLHHIDDRLEHHAPIMRIRTTFAFDWWETGRQPTPHHLQHLPRRCSTGIVLRLGHRRVPSSVVVIARPGLVPPPPAGPAQHCCHARLGSRHQLPEQMANFATTQSDRSPRWALKLAKLLVAASRSPLFSGATSRPVSARTTAKNAWAHMANVICRYHPVQLRTS